MKHKIFNNYQVASAKVLNIFWQQNYKPGMGLTFQEFVEKMHLFKEIGESETIGYLSRMEEEGLLKLDRKHKFAFLTQKGYVNGIKS